MGMNMSQRAVRAAVMQSCLADWAGGRLLLRCGQCGVPGVLPIAWLCHTYGGALRVGTVVNRLRCRVPDCGVPPDRVRIEGPRDSRSWLPPRSLLLVGPGAYD